MRWPRRGRRNGVSLAKIARIAKEERAEFYFRNSFVFRRALGSTD
jgi:hypothetical protein